MSENTMLVPQMGINMEQATANCEELAKAIHEITAGVLTTVNSFCRWIQQVAAEVAAQQEMETALRWASVDNRPLYNRYRHTKKKRIRKKYAKRILEWYRTEVARVEAESQQNQPLQSGGDIQAPAGYAPRGFQESEWPPGLLAGMDDGRRPHESVSFLLHGAPDPDDHDARRGGRAAVP